MGRAPRRVLDRVPAGRIGRWRVEGDRLITVGGDGAERVRRFRRLDGPDLEIDGIYTSRVPAFAPGRRLDGQWGGSAAIAGAAGAWTLRFLLDGTFISSGVTGAAVAAGGQTHSGESAAASRGTYELSANTLVLRHADGHVDRRTAYPFGEGEQTARPERINIDGMMFTRE